jgi:hypothetical protein
MLQKITFYYVCQPTMLQYTLLNFTTNKEVMNKVSTNVKILLSNMFVGDMCFGISGYWFALLTA